MSKPFFAIKRISRLEDFWGDLLVEVEYFRTSILDEPIVVTCEISWDPEWGIQWEETHTKDVRTDAVHAVEGWLTRSAKAQEVVQAWLAVEEMEGVVDHD